MGTTRWRQVALGTCAAILALVLGSGCADDEAPSVKWKRTNTMPADFPDDVPIYPKGELRVVITGEGVPTPDGAYFAWLTPDDIPSVRQFYTGKLDEKGWHVISYPGLPAEWMGEGGVTLVGTKWGRSITFALGARDGKTVITVMFPAKSS